MPISDSGFNEERFRKLVAMFDTPFREEAVVAFRKALDELAKDQTRFCDRLVDATEAKIAKAECKRIRTELSAAFAKLAKRESEAKQLEETITKLHARISLIEQVHRDNAARASAPEPNFDWRDNGNTAGAKPADSPKAEADDANFGFDFTAEPPPEQPVEPVAPLDPGPCLPFAAAFFWLTLLALAFCYIAWSIALGHPLTDDDWRNKFSLFVILAPLSALGLYLWGTRKGFSRTGFGQFCAESLGGKNAIVAGCYALLSVYFIVLVSVLGSGIDPKAYTHVGMLGLFLGLSFFVAMVVHEIRNYGFKGLLLHAFIYFDVMAAAYAVIFQRAPWTIANLPLPPATFHPAIVTVAGLLLTLVCWSDNITWWFLEDDKRTKWVVYPGAFVILLTLIAANETIAARTQQRSLPPNVHRHSPSSSTMRSAPPIARVAFTQDALPVDPVVEQQPSPRRSPTWKDDLFCVGGLILGIKLLAWRLEKARLRKAWRDANTFQPPNVHGAAGYADAKRARKGGWI